MSFNRTSAELKTLIDSWLTATNPGILLTEGNAARDGTSTFYESEGATQSRKPSLTITYNTVPEPTSTLLLATTGIWLMLCRKRTAPRWRPSSR